MDRTLKLPGCMMPRSRWVTKSSHRVSQVTAWSSLSLSGYAARLLHVTVHLTFRHAHASNAVANAWLQVAVEPQVHNNAKPQPMRGRGHHRSVHVLWTTHMHVRWCHQSWSFIVSHDVCRAGATRQFSKEEIKEGRCKPCKLQSEPPDQHPSVVQKFLPKFWQKKKKLARQDKFWSWTKQAPRIIISIPYLPLHSKTNQ